MAKRTVINRALKLPINSSDDSHLIIPDAEDDGRDPVTTTAHEEIQSQANGAAIGLTVEAKQPTAAEIKELQKIVDGKDDVEAPFK